jgi:predicted transcriptional regulator
MATVTIDMPDDLKVRCDNLLQSGTITVLLSRLLNEALEQETAQRAQAVDRLLARRKTTPPTSAD